MKRIFIMLATGAAFMFFVNTHTASAGSHPINIQSGNIFMQDTNPKPKRDSTKWNKKKYKDSTGRSKRDTVQTRP
jgi:hypothetical protein